MIIIKNLIKNYTNKNVLNNLSLKMPEKSIFGFIGINGAGKSTLIKCIFKLLIPDKGDIFINNENIKNTSYYKKNIGYLPEVFLPPLDLKVCEFLNYCNLLITNKSISNDIMDLALSQTGILPAKNILIRKLSKGMRQRLGIAQAIIHNPKLLILDEPFSGLDPIGRFELKNLFLSLNNSGKSIFFSSHNLNEIQDLCTDIAILHEGIIKIQGNVKEILKNFNSENLEKVFLDTINYNN